MRQTDQNGEAEAAKRAQMTGSRNSYPNENAFVQTRTKKKTTMRDLGNKTKMQKGKEETEK